MYANDLILLSLSVTDLQNLVNLCVTEFAQLDLPINEAKCHCICIGPRFKAVCRDISINDTSIKWIERTDYLGITLCSGSKFKCNWSEAKRKFYCASNIIIGRLNFQTAIALV